MKKIISCILVLCMIFSISSNSFAASAYMEQPSIEDTVVQLQEQFPDAVISVSNGVINILQMSPPVSSSSFRVSTYAPRGGSYRKFFPPFGVVGGPRPYSIVYLPTDIAKGFVSALQDENVFDVIVSTAIGLGVEKAIAAAAASFGITISAAAVTFLVAIGSYYVLGGYDAHLAYQATNVYSNGISIFRTTYDGWPTNMYFPWTNSYVTPDVYEEWNPTFYPGEYDI